MKVDILVAEIGSTTTVVNAFKDLLTDRPVFWAQGQAPTSVLDGDVRIGLKGAVDDLCRKKHISGLEYDHMLATSSAAGGLKMTVHGLVFDMTAKAAKEAALGAGAIIHFVTAGKLRRTDLEKIKRINPNLILISGGVDYGERDTALENAEKIRSLNLRTPVIYAGNIENQEEMKLIFDEESGQQLYIVENVYPKIDELNVEPCRRVIQEAFEKNITHAPGMEHVRDMVSGSIIPTPGAVMECAKVLYDCLGDLMVLDVGGATTDLHSVAVESDRIARILTAPEPKAKRTVEGDLGVYVNRAHVIESIGKEKLRKDCEKMGIDLDRTLEGYSAIPGNEAEIWLAERLAEEAVLKAVERHAGIIRYIYGPSGRSIVAEGKDLTQVGYIIGTGGALTRLPHGAGIIKEIPEHNESGMRLFPGKHVKILIDHDYIMASLGILSKKYRKAAIRLLENSLDFKFPEKKEEDKAAKYMADIETEEEEAGRKKKENEEHLAEVRSAGYDAGAFNEEERIGGASPEEVKAAKEAALGNTDEKREIRKRNDR